MRFVLSLFLIFICCVSGISQEGINPFEIQSRLDSVYQFAPEGESSSINIFDVQREDDRAVPVGSSIIDNIENETDIEKEMEESTIVPQVGEDDVGIDVDQAVNPFDVSHIPIRKSKLKKEANAFSTKKEVKKQHTSKEKGSNAFLFWLNLLTGFILAIVINTQRGALSKITKAITNENVLKLNYREEKKGKNGYYLLLYFSFFVNAAIFIYLVVYQMNGIYGWGVFQLIFLVVCGVYLVRHLFLSAVSKSFPIEKEVSLYGFTIQSFNLFIGILLIPMNLIIAFGPENIAVPLIYITLIIIGFLILLRSFRGLLISSRWISGNLFHFFLYLCAFEILPILLLIKVIGIF